MRRDEQGLILWILLIGDLDLALLVTLNLLMLSR